ncbi:MAG: NAD-dependent epimerase/dehydratase family protein [Methanocellales archaeon]|nr:NAD-dependent epimerase/dehydratase family protein [Methanocellales archaeon]MDD3421264.1 NAD-dependent epimerase/dehydratase family protein [Methanocellales archaeon]MDD4898416.1 NAD-dependent epimerase/dehydratase family protein [Methanocellales archaeon]MDD5446857.1 NAD-dependent epimerase/dehydratase family protein [Methanocellales archaeon]
MSSKIMVTGCSGFIGTHLAKRLIDSGFQVTGYDLNASLIRDRNFSLVRGDILDIEKLRNSMKGCKSVFHLAAQTKVPESTKDPIADFKTNSEGTFNVLSVAKEHNAKVVYASTSTVYGAADMPTKESHQLRPASFYGASKAAGDVYCSAFNSTFELDTVVLRIFNTYGPGNGKGVMYDLFKKLELDTTHLEIIGTGLQEKDYIYIDDTVEAFMTAYEKGVSGEAYNVGSGVSTTVNEIAEIIFDTLDACPKTTYTGESWIGDVESSLADISKLQKLGWHPKVSIKEGIEKVYEWMKLI